MAYVPFASDERLAELLPGWMTRRGREHWKALMRATMRVIDNVGDAVLRARLAGLPGQVTAADYAAGGPWPNTDALPLIGRDRGIRAGKHELPEQHAARLRDWIAARRGAATHVGLIHALRAVLRPTPPMVRLVRGGKVGEGWSWWWTLDDTGLRLQTWDGKGVFWPADGSAPEPDTTNTHAWDWDSGYWAGAPSPAPDPSRLWVIIYAPIDPEPSAIEGPYGDGVSVFGEKSPTDGDKLTIGTDATLGYVETVRAVADEFKAAGCSIPWILVTFDGDMFTPDGSGIDDYPDGYWRYHGKIVDTGGGVYERTRARSAAARYWVGTPTVQVNPIE